MVQVYIVFFKIFVFLLLGFALNKSKVIGSTGERALSDILLKAVLPVMIINSSQHTYSTDAVNGMIACAAIAIGYYAVSLIALRLSWKKVNILEDEKILDRMTLHLPIGNGYVREIGVSAGGTIWRNTKQQDESRDEQSA